MKIDEKTGVVYRQWDAASPRAALLLVHGLGAHSGRWEFLADFFLRNNISCFSIELKGFGQTQDLKGHIDSYEIYFEDIKRLGNIIKEENAQVKVFLLGESMGGLISFLNAIRNPDLFAGLICISPAFKGSLKFTPWQYIDIFSSLLYNPKKQFKMPFNVQMCTRDAAYQMVMDSDTREHRLATSRLLVETALAQIRAGGLKNRLKIPVLFLLSGKDLLTVPEESAKIFKSLRLENKALISYPDMYHALSIDLGREKVFEDILQWSNKLI